MITGTVQGTQSLGATSKGSEHEPDWAQAVVRIDTVEKGDTSLKTVVVYFPTSTDERWYLSPKFRPGQRGIWLLHREGNMGLPGGGFFALTPLDFHPLEEGETIRRLLR